AAMRGAAVMTGSIALDPQHPLASARQVVRRRAPHGADAADHDIKMRHNVGLAILSANRSYCDDACSTVKAFRARIAAGRPLRAAACGGFREGCGLAAMRSQSLRV